MQNTLTIKVVATVPSKQFAKSIVIARNVVSTTEKINAINKLRSSSKPVMTKEIL